MRGRFYSKVVQMYTGGRADKRKIRYRADNSPQRIHQRAIRSPKVTVCHAISELLNEYHSARKYIVGFSFP